MPNTPVYTDGVKYIKVAKRDNNNINSSVELQSLTDIRIKFSDIGYPVQYNVASVAEYSTYYLYSIFPLNVTSSADQEILDYRVSANVTSTQTFPNSEFLIETYDTLTLDPLGYFDASTGEWDLGNTPNIYLNVTCSITFDWSPGGFPSRKIGSISLYNLNNGTSFLLSPVPLANTNGSTTSWTATGSITPVAGDKYVVSIDTGVNGTFGETVSLFTADFYVNQPYAPESSNLDIVVLEPYVGANFYNSDCNVIQNNVDINNINALYMDVDFQDNQIVAQNQTSILNGTALRAQVQPWNYSYYSQISGRYIGKQQNAIALNTYTGPTNYNSGSSSAYGYTGSWPGDSASPGVIVPGNIVIQWLDSCIYEMNWGGPGFPENVNGGGLSMGNIYLVGETRDDVAIIKPGTDIYYDILEKTFPSGSPAFQYQYVNSPSLPTQLNITYPSLLLPNATYYLGSGAESNDIYGVPSATIGTFNPVGTPQPYLALGDIQLQGIWESYITQDGFLAQSDKNIGTIASTIEIISSSLSQGEKWFLSLYSGSGNASNPSTGLPIICSGSTNLLQYGYPFEISLAYTTSFFGGAFIGLKTGSGIYDVASFFSGSSPIPVGSSASKATTGFLITKAQTPTNGLTIFGPPTSNFAGAGKGYILSQYPKRVITQNIDYILKTYGNQPT
jgi:hypothetical protein